MTRYARQEILPEVGGAEGHARMRDAIGARQSVSPDARRAGVADFEAGAIDFDASPRVVVVRHSGTRAWRAAPALRRRYGGPSALIAMGGGTQFPTPVQRKPGS